MTQKFTFSVAKVLSATVDVFAETKEEAMMKATLGQWENLQKDDNSHAMGLDNWEAQEIIAIDDEVIE